MFKKVNFQEIWGKNETINQSGILKIKGGKMESINQLISVPEGNSFSSDSLEKIRTFSATLREDLSLITTGGFFQSNSPSLKFASFTLKVITRKERRESASLVRKIKILDDLTGQILTTKVVTDAMKALAEKFTRIKY